MSKHSSFPRVDRDLYETPWLAALPLLPHLHAVKTFAEPCAGPGMLVRHLVRGGLTCVYQADIEYGHDARDMERTNGADVIITNPPYQRVVMHQLITRFMSLAPTWLLLEWEWAQTRQARPFLRHCTDIVAVGRVRWFVGTADKSKDSFAWFRFDQAHTTGSSRFYPIGMLPHRSMRCDNCQEPFAPTRSDSRYCSGRCRMAAHRVTSRR